MSASLDFNHVYTVVSWKIAHGRGVVILSKVGGGRFLRVYSNEFGNIYYIFCVPYLLYSVSAWYGCYCFLRYLYSYLWYSISTVVSYHLWVYYECQTELYIVWVCMIIGWWEVSKCSILNLVKFESNHSSSVPEDDSRLQLFSDMFSHVLFYMFSIFRHCTY